MKKKKPLNRRLVNGGDPEKPFEVPLQVAFVDEATNELNDYLSSTQLRELASALIERYEEFQHLQDFSLAYLWKRKGPSSSGHNTLGKCQRLTGMLKFFAKYDFVIWLSADHCHGLTAFQIEALVFHEMMHAGAEDGKPAIRKHDWEGFAAEVHNYGEWKSDMTAIGDAFQFSLFGG
jgi:hypothetical protein